MKGWLASLEPATRTKLAGITCIVAAMQIVPFNDAIAKYATQVLPVLMVVFLRTFTQSCCLLLYSGVRGTLPRWHMLAHRWNIVRGFCWWLATLVFFFAIRDDDIPAALALFFTGPLFVAITAPLFLREPFVPRFVAAAAIGFVGALFIMRPDVVAFSPVLLLSFLGGIVFSCYMMSTRYITNKIDITAVEAALAAGLWASLFGLPLAIWMWAPMPLELVGWFVLLGMLSASGHVLIAMASQRVLASNLAPYAYTEMFGAVLSSYWFFETFPATSVWIGIALIVSSGVWAAMVTRTSTAAIEPPV